MSRAALVASIVALALAGAAFAGCDVTGGDDDETVATPTTTTTETEATGATGPSKSGDTNTDTGGEGGGSGSGGTAAPEDDGYDPEQDVPGNDIPPPPGSPQEKFEQECKQNPGIC